MKMAVAVWAWSLMNTVSSAVERSAGNEWQAFRSAWRKMNGGQPHEGEAGGHFIRVIVADTQAIFRAGLRKIFALEDDLRVVGQSETLAQTLSAVRKFSSDILIFEAALAPNPAEAVVDLLRQVPSLRIVVVTAEPNEELTLELSAAERTALFHARLSRKCWWSACTRSREGQPWLDSRGTQWVLEAYRTQGIAAHVVAHQGAAHSERIADCFLRDAGNEEQRDRVASRHYRAGGQKLSPQSL